MRCATHNISKIVPIVVIAVYSVISILSISPCILKCYKFNMKASILPHFIDEDIADKSNLFCYDFSFFDGDA